MVQELTTQPSIFGRLGKGLGQGLAEQVPKEVERYRLSQGLQELSKQSANLSPLEFATKAFSTYGITPEMTRQLGELAKQQNIRQAYQNTKNQEIKPAELKSEGNQQNFVNRQQNQINQQQTSENVSPEEFGQPQIEQKNPLRQERQPRSPWTPEQRNEDRRRVSEDFPWMNPKEIEEMSADNEARYLSQPSAEKAQDVELNQIKNQLRDQFIDELKTVLQTDEKGIFKSVSGEDLSNLIRGMERDLRTTPGATVDDVVNRWKTKALDLAKTKTQLGSMSGSSNFISNLLEKSKNLNKLKEYGDIYRKAGNSEEYFNTLKSKHNSETGQAGFSMSPGGAATIAYPLNKNQNSYIEKINPKPMGFDHATNARKIASDIEKIMTSDTSFLTIARALKFKDPNFDETAFFEQLGEDKDNLPMNSRQRNELAEGASDIIPSWGDTMYLPVFRGLK